jgi:peptide/nickel transport system substrate-binding protein
MTMFTRRHGMALVLTALPLPTLAQARSDRVVVALGTEPTTLDPQAAQDGSERAVSRNIFETLLARTPAGELIPGLAADMPTQSGPNAWRFRLRQGIRFHNGEPFNADSAVHSVNRIVNRAFGSRQLPFFTGVQRAEKVDNYTLDVVSAAPDPSLPTRMYWLTQVPASYSSDPAFPSRPVGTGPYRFVEWVRGQRIVIERNPDYWGDRPEVGSGLFRFVAEPGTRLAGLRAGEFDLITNLQPEHIRQVPQAPSVLGVEMPFVSLSTEAGITRDVRVRRALNYAVDKRALAEALFEGFAEPARGQLLAPNWFGFNEALQPWPYDAARARALLREAGALGQTIELMGSNGRWLKDKELTEAVGAYWEAAGLRVTVRIVDWREYLDTLQNNRISKPVAIQGSHSNQLFDADRTVSAYFTEGAASGTRDPRLVDLTRRARSETDVARRRELYAELTRIVNEDAIIVFLLHTKSIFGLSARVQGPPRADDMVLLREMRLPSA